MTPRRKSSRLRAWGRQQLYSFFSSLGSLLSHRLGTLMTVLVLGIAMTLPLGLYVAVQNLDTIDLQEDRWGTITVFLKQEAGDADVNRLAAAIENQLDAAVDPVSPALGMEEFREASGFGEALDLFDENPLPWVLHITPRVGEGEDLGGVVAESAVWLEAQPGVDLVQVDHKWLERLARLLELGQALVTVLAVVLSLAVVVVVANTIRLDVANRAAEIQVLNMVGAPNGFIRQPFLYSGFWYGLMGALLALLFLHLAFFYLQAPMERLLDAYGNAIEIRGAGLRETVAVLLGGAMLGLAGSWIAVRRHLRQFRLEEMPRKS
jgi:cell division transport system permease protein